MEVERIAWVRRSESVWELPAAVRIVVYKVDGVWKFTSPQVGLSSEVIGSVSENLAKGVAYERVLVHLEGMLTRLKNTKPTKSEAVMRRAPVQSSWRARRPAGTVSWDEHCKAWEVYQARFGNHQSAERIAQRGGFSWSELVALLGHEPETWQPRAERVGAL